MERNKPKTHSPVRETILEARRSLHRSLRQEPGVAAVGADQATSTLVIWLKALHSGTMPVIWSWHGYRVVVRRKKTLDASEDRKWARRVDKLLQQRKKRRKKKRPVPYQDQPLARPRRIQRPKEGDKKPNPYYERSLG